MWYGHRMHLSIIYCCLKACVYSAYIILSFLDSFRNKSGKPQPIRTKVGTHAQLKGRQRSRNFGHDRLSGGELGGLDVSPTPGFFCKRFSATSQRSIFTKFGPDTWIGDETQILDKFEGSFAPKTPNLEGVKQGALQVKGCTAGRYCFTPRCSPRARELPRSGYGASKLPTFRILAYFPHTKRLKSTFRVTSLRARSYIAEWFRFFRVITEGPKGCLPAAEFSCDFW